MGDAAYTRAQEKLENQKDDGAMDLVMFRLEKANLQAALRERRNVAELLAEKDERAQKQTKNRKKRIIQSKRNCE